MSIRWKETAWNGVRFHTPADWDIAKIGKQYLLFEDEDRPVLEIKWNTIKGTFSHKKHLRRLTALHGKKDAHLLEQWKIPDHWAQALKRYEISGFSWESTNLNGKGTILYCPECGNATFIQFYHKDSEIDVGLTTHILKSLEIMIQENRPNGPSMISGPKSPRSLNWIGTGSNPAISFLFSYPMGRRSPCTGGVLLMFCYPTAISRHLLLHGFPHFQAPLSIGHQVRIQWNGKTRQKTRHGLDGATVSGRNRPTDGSVSGMKRKRIAF